MLIILRRAEFRRDKRNQMTTSAAAQPDTGMASFRMSSLIVTGSIVS